mgnify:FL=1
MFLKVCKMSGSDRQGNRDPGKWAADSVSQPRDQRNHRHDVRDPELAQERAAWSALSVSEGETGPAKAEPTGNT